MVLFNLRKKIALAKLGRTSKVETKRIKQLQKKAREEMQLEKINQDIRRIKMLSKTSLSTNEKKALAAQKKRAMLRRKATAQALAKTGRGVVATGKALNKTLAFIGSFAPEEPKKRKKPVKRRTATKKRKATRKKRK